MGVEREDDLGRLAGSSQSPSSKQRKVSFANAVPLNDTIDVTDVTDGQTKRRCEQVSLQTVMVPISDMRHCLTIVMVALG